jgi:diguanylate cyclase (GGDEF)-like protein
VGRSDAELFDSTIATGLRAADQTALAQPQPLNSDHTFEFQGTRREFQVLRAVLTEGQERWVLSVWQDLAPERQREHQLKVALDQLEQQQKANDQLRRDLSDQARRDQASGLHSRAHFEEQMRRELDLSTREHREFALVYMSLDPFDEQARALGARAHDRICEAMGRLLRGNTRAMDTSCRLDDRHFAVLLSGVGLATAHSRMEGLRRQCATQIVMLEGTELGFSVAMGVASFPHTAQSHEDLVKACKGALEEAQRRGGNTVALASIRLDNAP